MVETTKKLGRLIAVAALAATALMASATSAQAGFNPSTGSYVQQGTLTLEYAGQTKQCTWSSTHSGFAVNTSAPCAGGGWLQLHVYEMGHTFGGTPKVGFSKLGITNSPWGEILEFSLQADAVNGSSSTPTRIVPNHTQIGKVYTAQYGLQPIYITADIAITTASGGLVTIN